VIAPLVANVQNIGLGFKQYWTDRRSRCRVKQILAWEPFILHGLVVLTKSALVVPRSVRRRAGLKRGPESGIQGIRWCGLINIVPKLPVADDEYIPAQRRLIDARLQ